jgi:hypothetical protein
LAVTFLNALSPLPLYVGVNYVISFPVFFNKSVINSGGSCKSPSMITTAFPFEASKPAVTAI